jgi:hypothetical protein
MGASVGSAIEKTLRGVERIGLANFLARRLHRGENFDGQVDAFNVTQITSETAGNSRTSTVQEWPQELKSIADSPGKHLGLNRVACER